MLEIYTAAFFDHRHIDNLHKVSDVLEEQIINLINEKEFVNFIGGRNGDLDQGEVEIPEKTFKSHPRVTIQIRNEEMVDRADLILCYIKHNSGGTYKIIEYAKKQNKIIINLAK